MLPEAPPAAPKLERRTPGETDLRVFTHELIPPGRHRIDRRRHRLRLARDRATDRPVLRLVTPPGVGVLAAGDSSSSPAEGEG